MMVEIIARVYYAALEEAARSPMLRAICGRVRRDEEAHVRFQAERLAILRRDRSQSGMSLTRLLHRALFCGACLGCGTTTAGPSGAAASGFKLTGDAAGTSSAMPGA